MSADRGDPRLLLASTSDGLDLAVHRVRPRPDAPAVMLLHGLAANRYTFDFPGCSLAEYLANAGFDCFVPELRGAGMSARPKGRWHFDDYLERDLPAILACIQAASGRASVHWVGHSMGGLLLMCYALRHPKAPIGSGLAAAAALDYRGSVYEKLLPAKRFLAYLPLLPWRPLARLGAPLVGRVPLGIERFHFFTPNMDEQRMRRAFALLFDSVSPEVIEGLATVFSPRGLCSRTGHLAYTAQASTWQLPLRLLGGNRDVQCPPRAIRTTAARLGLAESQVTIFSRGRGWATDYGHFDLLIGKQAPREVWPEIAQWLKQQSV